MLLPDLFALLKRTYNIPEARMKLIRDLDPEALTHISHLVSNSPHKLGVADAYEVIKWGTLRDLSRYPEIRKTAPERKTTCRTRK